MNSQRMFFVTGLPRTRTAWLSNLLTTSNSICLHDALRAARTRDGLLALSSLPYVGVADAFLALFPSAIAPGDPLVVINRSYDDVHGRMAQLWPGSERMLPSLYAALDTLKSSHAHIEIDFRDLDDPHYVSAIWHYCVPGISWDGDRYEQLRRLKVEVRDDLALQGAILDTATVSLIANHLEM